MTRKKSNVRQEANAQGYRSGLEFSIASNLTDRGVDFEYEAEAIEYHPSPRWYLPDFVLPNGIILEVKGRLTQADRRKHLEVRDSWPELDIRFIFACNNKLSKRSKMRYSDWCEKHGFKYAFKTVPQEWIDE